MSLPLRRLLAAGWTILILLLLSLPGESLPDLALLSYDKAGHFVLFAVLGWLWMAAMTRPLPARTWWVLTGGSVFAAMSELYQGLLPWQRLPDVYDVLADMLGLFAAVQAYRLRHRKHARPAS
ncbi:VanZ family protein [Rhodocaloribacter litoris]|uniref:VanZ family protein n=1 Tax=Rhodocaloribacter litoris TaxID=2558931 RepID=UPI00141ECB3B|nr:VanZ family protein [Rhodocaloribacter litoris]QXD14162.1 VanZ family protein [Rhodocaloribacter litoris]GIV59967.1 MAG: hypothetical protein KatS3mg043_1056 [Rhodothermaceae bacterium]